MFPNLRAEMARKGIESKTMSLELDVTAKTISNKLCGKSEFTLSEMLAIKYKFFPSMTLEYLFERKVKTTA
ncbi:hypothetical protein [Chengkuizengella axinellae]|uniref:XRE family transcriptional regulator n=1 Tax=Chengkuizengella axinellae TaxID=3064388 RepID=A0ABT9J4L8_9BACL|nr:hypothetical protein [Chengkuizengella sp. 2205SS18-9]MDP5276559.1 hypothetical protein [Chengkuizengella sp. 2205SS18-9]